MAVSFVQPGKQMKVTLTADTGYHALVAIGDNMIGVSRAAGKSGDVVAVDVEGVFEFAKASGSALNQGTPVTVAVDGTTHLPTAAATSAGSTSNGVVWETAASDATSVLVKINERIAVPAAAAGNGG